LQFVELELIETRPFVVGSRSVCFHAISMPELLLVGKLTIPAGFLWGDPAKIHQSIKN
jgi:hypothetical protein